MFKELFPKSTSSVRMYKLNIEAAGMQEHSHSLECVKHSMKAEVDFKCFEYKVFFLWLRTEGNFGMAYGLGKRFKDIFHGKNWNYYIIEQAAWSQGCSLESKY